VSHSEPEGSSSSWAATRGPHSATYVLFAFGDAGWVSAIDSGTGGSPEFDDHVAAHALTPTTLEATIEKNRPKN